MISQGGPAATIGMSNIKQARLRMPVKCHPGDFVGDYVPFNFCPRSLMLYVIFKANHSELAYRRGQGPIVHLEADLYTVINWAQNTGRHWAFTPQNARAVYGPFYASVDELDLIDWQAVAARNWQSCAEKKQAEFLVHESFPWNLVTRVGVQTAAIRQRASVAIRGGDHRPTIAVKPDWYY